MDDPIVEEVCRIRAVIAARNGNDLRRIFEDARTSKRNDGRRVVSYDPADNVEPSSIVRDEPPKKPASTSRGLNPYAPSIVRAPTHRDIRARARLACRRGLG